MDRDELLEQVAEDIFSYVMQGVVPEQKVASVIKPDELEERFADYELLLDLHFILTQDVVDFVSDIQQHIRDIQTNTASVARTKRGTVDGKINWGGTIKRRYTQSPGDRSVFVIENRTENYDTAENLVFKRLLSIIQHTLSEAEEHLVQDYRWVHEHWNQERIDTIQRLLEQNVHLRRVREPDEYEPTDRMLNAAKQSRQEVYRTAAELLETRQRLFDGNPEQLEQLLRRTAITPDDDDALFELFVLFQFITAAESIYDGSQAEFDTITTERDAVARIDGPRGQTISIYYDTAASDRDVSICPYTGSTEEQEESRRPRAQLVHEKEIEVANEYYEDQTFRHHTARPDLLAIEVAADGDRAYLIVEVKNSTREKTIQQGIRETLEYLAYLRENGEFVLGSTEGEQAGDEGQGSSETSTSNGEAEYFGSGWNGLLVIQDLPERVETASVSAQEDSPITILQASELSTELEPLLERAVRAGGANPDSDT